MVERSEVASVMMQMATPVLLGTILWLGKRWVDKIEKAIEDVGKQLQQARLDFACDYRLKREAEADSAKQWDKIDQHETRITRVETLVIGDGK
ncbi:hypothetical protein JCM15519_07140 [Fundidesulfovibrio butyratiphilus]